MEQTSITKPGISQRKPDNNRKIAAVYGGLRPPESRRYDEKQLVREGEARLRPDETSGTTAGEGGAAGNRTLVQRR